MSKEIVLAPVPANDATLAPIQDRMAYVQALSTCTLIPPELRNPANALMVLDYGMALGIPAMQAFMSINIIKGKPSTSPALMSAVVRRAGHRLRVRVTGDPLTVTATLVRADDPDFEFVAVWNLAKAQRAGLYPGRPGSGWDRYPDQMLRARAISEVCRQGAEDALAGVTYTPEELLTEPAPAPAPTVEAQAAPAPAPMPTPTTPAPVTGTEYATGPEPVEDTADEDAADESTADEGTVNEDELAEREADKGFICHVEGWSAGKWDEYVRWFLSRQGVTGPTSVQDMPRPLWDALMAHLLQRPAVAAALKEKEARA